MGFLWVFLAVLALIAGAYAAVVISVNPRREFWSERFPEHVPNSRAWKLAAFDAYHAQAPVRAVLLGSSREMNLRPQLVEALTGRRTFQLGVLAAVPEDYLALYRYLVHRNATPELLFVGIDLATLGAAAPVPYDLQHSLTLQSLLDGAPPSGFDRLAGAAETFKRIYTVSYALDTRRSVMAALRHQEPRNRFDPDGTMHYPIWDREIAAGTFATENEMAACVSRLGKAHAAMTPLSAERTRALATLADEAKAHGTRVVFWVTPAHPRLLAHFEASPALQANNARAYAFLDSLRTRTGATVLDLTHIESYGGDARDWYECVHVRDAEAERLTRALVARGL
jgi:hypothetical protein